MYFGLRAGRFRFDLLDFDVFCVEKSNFVTVVEEGSSRDEL